MNAVTTIIVLHHAVFTVRLHGIAVAILSVRLSVRPLNACIVTKLNDALRIF